MTPLQLYASALFSLALDEGIDEEILSELKQISAVFSENDGYLSILDSPSIPVEERIAMIDEAFSGAHEYVCNFLKILCEKKMVGLFKKCAAHYEKLFNKEHNIENVTVITATALSNSLKERLTAKLKKDSGKEIVLSVRVDPSILGGLIIQTENSQTDVSVRNRLDKLRTLISHS